MNEKTIRCEGWYSRTHKEIAEINEEKYWKIYHKVWYNWDQIIARSKVDNISVADVIARDYDTCYAVGADIAASIALRKVIG
jgi:hypothetical protein